MLYVVVVLVHKQIIPQGVMCLLIEAQALHGSLSVTLPGHQGTFVDPRCGRGTPLVPASAPQYVKPVAGKPDLLTYSLPALDVVWFNAPAADHHGNIYNRGAPVQCEMVEMAMAARRNGGVVIALVGMLVEPGCVLAASLPTLSPHHLSMLLVALHTLQSVLVQGSVVCVSCLSARVDWHHVSRVMLRVIRYGDITVPTENVDFVVVHRDVEGTLASPHNNPLRFLTLDSTTSRNHGLARARFLNGLVGATPVCVVMSCWLSFILQDAQWLGSLAW